MRFEDSRRMPLAMAMVAAIGLGLGWSSTSRADGYHLHPTIPPLAPAYDYTTGGEFMAPPVPFGHYAKDHPFNPRHILGCASCRLHGLMSGHGFGHGQGCGHGTGAGHFGHGGTGSACGVADCGGGFGCGHHKAAGRFAPIDCGSAAVPVVAATSQSPSIGMAVVQPSSQYPCGDPGCGISTRHSHGKGKHGGGYGDPGCGFCGGKGCSHCLSGLHGKLSSLTGWLHHGPKVDYFLGAGGPVPITPGYVPYVVATRSPRDFFSFPPMNPFDP